MNRKLIDEIFRYEIQVARGRGETKEVLQSIHWDHRYELNMLYEEEMYIRSGAVLVAARNLDIALLPRPLEDDGSEDWEGGQYFYEQTLSQIGRAKLRDAIRKEKKERYEGWTRWMPLVTALIAACGIATTIITRK